LGASKCGGGPDLSGPQRIEDKRIKLKSDLEGIKNRLNSENAYYTLLQNIFFSSAV
jgi:hypothetical protein